MDKYEPFKSSDYPTKKYLIKLDTATFSKFRIEFRHVKMIDDSRWDSTSFYCRGWLTIRLEDTIITKQFFRSIEAVGGCSGLFVPDTQPREDFFIFSKLGDYSGIIFIVDATGNMTQKIGGSFCISKDKRYLFSNYDSDLEGLTVYDLDKHLLLYSAYDQVPQSLGAWYFQDGKYFARAYDNDLDDDGQKIKIATFDFKTNKLVITTVDKDFLKSRNQLKFYNDLQDVKDCSCGMPRPK
jgi:hypothetical protein